MKGTAERTGNPAAACRMIVTTLLYFVTAGGILSGVCTVGCSASQTESLLPAPEKALLVLSRINWGCLAGQEIVRDVSVVVSRGDGQPVRVEEILNPEDRDDHLSLDLYFPVSKTPGTGYYLWRIRVSGKGPENPGWLEVDHASIQASPKELALKIRGRASGIIRASLLYAPDAVLSKGLFTCSAAGLFEADPVPFIPSYGIAEVGSLTRDESRESGEFRFSAGEGALMHAQQVILASQLLKALDKHFAVPGEYAFHWDAARVTSEELDRISRSIEGDQAATFRVLVRLRDRGGEREIVRSPEPFDPLLLQMISVREPGGSVTGGEIRVSVDSKAE